MGQCSYCSGGIVRRRRGVELTENSEVNMMDFKKIEVRRGCEWEPIEFEHLRKGDVFKVVDPPELGLFIAKSDPHKCEPEGNWGIIIEGYVEG